MKPTKDEPKQNRKRTNVDQGRFSSGCLGEESDYRPELLSENADLD